jgi:hypothetical protein
VELGGHPQAGAIDRPHAELLGERVGELGDGATPRPDRHSVVAERSREEIRGADARRGH